MASKNNGYLTDFIGFYRCLYSLVNCRYTRLLEGAVQIEIIDKIVKKMWSHLNETEFFVDFKSVSNSRRGPIVFLLWVNKEGRYSLFPKAGGIT